MSAPLSLYQAIDQCLTLKDLARIVVPAGAENCNEVHPLLKCEIGRFGGRYYTIDRTARAHDNNAHTLPYTGRVSLNDIIKKLDSLARESLLMPPNKDEGGLVKLMCEEIRLIDRNGEAVLKEKNCLLKLLTKIRRFFGSCDFDRGQVLLHDIPAASMKFEENYKLHVAEQERQQALAEKRAAEERERAEQQRKKDEARKIAEAALALSQSMKKYSMKELLQQMDAKISSDQQTSLEKALGEKIAAITNPSQDKEYAAAVDFCRTAMTGQYEVFATIVAEHLPVPLWQVCECVSVISSFGMGKALIDTLSAPRKLAEQIKKRAILQRRSEDMVLPDAVSEQANRYGKTVVNFRVQEILINFGKIFPTGTALKEKTAALDILTEGLKLVYEEYGNQFVEGLSRRGQKAFDRKKDEIGVSINLTYNYNEAHYLDQFLPLMLSKLTKVAGLATLRISDCSSPTKLEGAVAFAVAPEYNKLVKDQPGLVYFNSWFGGNVDISLAWVKRGEKIEKGEIPYWIAAAQNKSAANPTNTVPA